MRRGWPPFIGGDEEWRPLNVPCQRSVCFFTMAIRSNRHRINGGDGVELCFFACLHALRRWSKGRSVRGYFCRMPGCHRHGKTTNKRHVEGEHERRQVGGRATPGVGRSLTKSSRHCLHIVGSRVGLDHSSIGTLPQMLWFDGPFLFILLRKSTSRSAFWCILSCICAYVLHNDNLPNTCGTWLVVNAYVFKFVNFSPFYVLVGS
jgi:hypothetical protein